MALLVIAYPNINQSDFDHIQVLRREHDRQFEIFNPHITLVFSTNKLSSDDLAEHVKAHLADHKSFPITLDSVKVVEDDSKNFFHAFLIPSDGFSGINTLHDLLYKDTLSSELRHDIPFIPHLGIGSGNKAEMLLLTDRLNGQSISIAGYLDKVTIVEYDGGRVKDLTDILLA